MRLLDCNPERTGYDPYMALSIYKTQAYTIIEFDVYWVNDERDTAFQSLPHLLKIIRTLGQLFSDPCFFVNLRCILFKIDSINTKLGEFCRARYVQSDYVRLVLINQYYRDSFLVPLRLNQEIA